jgi:hypothetical protein
MKKFDSHHMALCLAVLGISACTANWETWAATAAAADAAQLPVLVRQSVRNQQTLQALFLGRLHLDANGCLRGENDAGPIIIWHHDTSIERAPDGRIRIVDTKTGNAFNVGEEIALSGGHRAGPASNVTEPVPPACHPQDRVFIAGPVMSEVQRQDLLERQRNRPLVPPPSGAKP